MGPWDFSHHHSRSGIWDRSFLTFLRATAVRKIEDPVSVGVLQSVSDRDTNLIKPEKEMYWRTRLRQCAQLAQRTLPRLCLSLSFLTWLSSAQTFPQVGSPHKQPQACAANFLTQEGALSPTERGVLA